MSLEMEKPTSTLHNLGSWTTLSLFRLGVSLAVALRQSHASRSSGFVDVEALTFLTALQQTLDGLSWFVVRKGKHVSNESFACTQLNSLTGFMAAIVTSSTTAKPKTDVDTLFIFTLCFFLNDSLLFLIWNWMMKHKGRCYIYSVVNSVYITIIHSNKWFS